MLWRPPRPKGLISHPDVQERIMTHWGESESLQVFVDTGKYPMSVGDG